MTKLVVAKVADKLREYHGNQSAVARSFGVTRQAVEACVRRHPSLQAVLAETNETILDHAESALYRSVLAGEFPAVKWLLATKGKGRGYVERSEVTGKDGNDITITVRRVSNASPDV